MYNPHTRAMLSPIPEDDPRRAVPGVKAAFEYRAPSKRCNPPKACFDGDGNLITVVHAFYGHFATKFDLSTGKVVWANYLSLILALGGVRATDDEVFDSDITIGYFHLRRHLVVYTHRRRSLQFFKDGASLSFVCEVMLSPMILKRFKDNLWPLAICEATRTLALLNNTKQVAYLFSLEDYSTLLRSATTVPSHSEVVAWDVCFDQAGCLVALECDESKDTVALRRYSTSSAQALDCFARPELGDGSDIQYVESFVQLGTDTFLAVGNSIGGTVDGRHLITYSLDRARGCLASRATSVALQKNHVLDFLVGDIRSGRQIAWITPCYNENNHDGYFLLFEDHFAPRMRFGWSLALRHMVPRDTKAVVETVTFIRSLMPDTPLGALPNELLFLVFELL